MNIHIALFRGINVGGRHMIPMRDLAGILENMGFTEVRTYIQSGNVVFHSKTKCARETAGEIASRVMESHGFQPKVLILDVPALKTAIENNPFGAGEGKGLHFYFLETKPENPDLTRLEQIKSASEEFKLKGSVFYLLAPNGIGRSRLAAAVERSMGVEATARNWNTVSKLNAMVGA